MWFVRNQLLLFFLQNARNFQDFDCQVSFSSPVVVHPVIRQDAAVVVEVGLASDSAP